MIPITLYTKDPCPLCDDVKDLLVTLADTYPHTLTEVDITRDQELNARYRFEIPVLQIGESMLKAPIGLTDLTKFLREGG